MPLELFLFWYIWCWAFARRAFFIFWFAVISIKSYGRFASCQTNSAFSFFFYCLDISALMAICLFTIRPNVPYIKISSDANSSIGGTDGTGR
jgi:hypothetical protein